MLTLSHDLAGERMRSRLPCRGGECAVSGAPDTRSQNMVEQAARLPGRVANATGVTVPDVAVRLAGAMLALAVAAVHVADQGGLTAFNSPDWIGWGYRLIEAGGVLTAVVLLLRWPGRPALASAGWAPGVLLGTGPFVAYLLSRSVGVPGDPG